MEFIQVLLLVRHFVVKVTELTVRYRSGLENVAIGALPRLRFNNILYFIFTDASNSIAVLEIEVRGVPRDTSAVLQPVKMETIQRIAT